MISACTDWADLNVLKNTLQEQVRCSTETECQSEFQFFDKSLSLHDLQLE
jgi:hypothetical protein